MAKADLQRAQGGFALDTLLFYNDTGGEGLGQKSDGIHSLVKTLVQKDVPIHGVGLQMRTGTGHPPNIHDVERNMQRIAGLGLQVHKMDVRTDVTTEDQQEQFEAQARIYASIAELCLAQPACTAVVTWGFSDSNYAHDGRPDASLIYDANYQRKPAYWTLIKVFCHYPRLSVGTICLSKTEQAMRL